MSEARTGSSGIAEDAKVVGDKLGPQVAKAAGKVADMAESGDIKAVGNELKGAAGDIKDAALEHGQQLFEAAKSTATSFADQRENDAAQSVADLAASLRETGRGFGDRGNLQAFVGTAADGLEQLATGIRERTFADIYADAEDYARRSPVTVAAMAAVGGFLLARFIKSSADDLAETASVRDRARRAESTRRRSSPARADV